MFSQLAKSPLTMVSIILLACSTYFFFGAQKIIAERATTALKYFKDGTRVILLGPQDGDELEIRDADGRKAIVRLQGIKTFSQSAKESRNDGFANGAMKYMATYEGKMATIRVKGKPTKGRKLIIAYVDLDGPKEGQSIDLGLKLIEQGFSVVHTRFPAAREGEYLNAEKMVRDQKKGLWANEDMKRRVTEAKVAWNRARNEKETKK